MNVKDKPNTSGTLNAGLPNAAQIARDQKAYDAAKAAVLADLAKNDFNSPKAKSDLEKATKGWDTLQADIAAGQAQQAANEQGKAILTPKGLAPGQIVQTPGNTSTDGAMRALNRTDKDTVAQLAAKNIVPKSDGHGGLNYTVTLYPGGKPTAVQVAGKDLSASANYANIYEAAVKQFETTSPVPAGTAPAAYAAELIGNKTMTAIDPSTKKGLKLLDGVGTDKSLTVISQPTPIPGDAAGQQKLAQQVATQLGGSGSVQQTSQTPINPDGTPGKTTSAYGFSLNTPKGAMLSLSSEGWAYTPPGGQPQLVGTKALAIESFNDKMATVNGSSRDKTIDLPTNVLMSIGQLYTSGKA